MFTILLFFPSHMETSRSTIPHGWVEESLNAIRFIPSYGFKYFLCNPNFIKILRFLWTSIVNKDSWYKWFAMVVVMIYGNGALGVPSIFLWSRNPKVGISIPCLLICIVDLRELCGGGSFSLWNFPQIKSTNKIGVDPTLKESKVFSK